MKLRNLLTAVLSLALAALAPLSAQALTSDEARAIAKDAYIYGFPLVDHYRITHAYFVDSESPEFKAPMNQISNVARVYTHEDVAVQTANSDTPYSFAFLDLRAEPMVLSLPPIEAERYYSVQLIDGYTHSFDYFGSRTTGNAGGHYMVAGPDWRGETPAGISKLARAETQFVLAGYRTQLSNPSDLPRVKEIQSGYQVQPLSAFLRQRPPASPGAVDFPQPLSKVAQKSDLRFFELLNFWLSFCPTHPSEVALMRRFASIQVGPGLNFDAGQFSPEVQQALRDGMADAWAELARLRAEKIATHQIDAGDLLGAREVFDGNYLYRMAGAVIGIYGNAEAEATYPVYAVDSAGRALDGQYRYRLRFPAGALPPAHAFWSLTMYRMPESLLVANPLNRYLINSPMLPQMQRDADGGLTLYLQKDSPGGAKETNWLPTPEGAFAAYMRIYWPKPEALNGQWQAPVLERLP